MTVKIDRSTIARDHITIVVEMEEIFAIQDEVDWKLEREPICIRSGETCAS